MKKKPVFIILEGPDKVGKSTLSKKLVKKLGAYYHHEGPPPKGKNLFRHYVETIQKLGQIFLGGRSVVADRLYFGELIYGPILRGKSLLSPWDARRLELLLMKYGAIQFFITADWDIVEARYKTQDPPDELLKPGAGGLKLLKKIRTRYNVMHPLSGVPGHQVDFSIPVDTILRSSYWLRTSHNHGLLKKLNSFGGVGSSWPFTIIVGDKRNKKASKGLPWPFFGDSGSSRWLFEALDEIFMHSAGWWNRLYYTNSTKDDGSKITADEFQTLAKFMPGGKTKMTILTLGDNALSRVLDIRRKLPKNMVIKTMPHPQYLKRFRSKYRAFYLEQLQEHIYAWHT